MKLSSDNLTNDKNVFSYIAIMPSFDI